jgi:putative membrane protein insertion efficiency factor
MVTIRSMVLFSLGGIALFAVVAPAFGQQPDSTMKELAFLRKNVPIDSASKLKEPLLSGAEVSDAKLIARFMIRVYQRYVSTQQHNVCVFTPSCSHFGMESVERCGFVRGVLLTADRLTRCNSFVAQGGYALDPVTGKYIDEVSTHCRDSAEANTRPSSGNEVLP